MDVSLAVVFSFGHIPDVIREPMAGGADNPLGACGGVKAGSEDGELAGLIPDRH